MTRPGSTLLLVLSISGCPQLPAGPPPPAATPAMPAAQVPAAAPATSATVTVTLEAQKASGREWDAAGDPPDIALCVRSLGAAGGGTTCYPSGSSSVEVHEPQCPNALECTFGPIALPAQFEVQVLDVDLLANDLVGQATCSVGALCRAGQSLVLAGVASPVAIPAPGTTVPGAAGVVPAAAPRALTPGAAATIATVRTAATSFDLATLRGRMDDEGMYMAGPGLVAQSANAAIDAWRRNPAAVIELARLLERGCASSLEDGEVTVVCPPQAAGNDDYEGAMAMFEEEDEDTWELVFFATGDAL